MALMAFRNSEVSRLLYSVSVGWAPARISARSNSAIKNR